ncbi:hypothetical protein NPIL_217521 [Nephila pilipes]|uniref:Uncharacterized protein n=1 Tax=Nephila pilipes TaxID=299642 RepID=A0A8X6P9R9_NEPPI|nr:hypothetical protein NPIL_217521 [Nephila pilipes]
MQHTSQRSQNGRVSACGHPFLFHAQTTFFITLQSAQPIGKLTSHLSTFPSEQCHPTPDATLNNRKCQPIGKQSLTPTYRMAKFPSYTMLIVLFIPTRA